MKSNMSLWTGFILAAMTCHSVAQQLPKAAFRAIEWAQQLNDVVGPTVSAVELERWVAGRMTGSHTGSVFKQYLVDIRERRRSLDEIDLQQSKDGLEKVLEQLDHESTAIEEAIKGVDARSDYLNKVFKEPLVFGALAVRGAHVELITLREDLRAVRARLTDLRVEVSQSANDVKLRIANPNARIAPRRTETPPTFLSFGDDIRSLKDERDAVEAIKVDGSPKLLEEFVRALEARGDALKVSMVEAGSLANWLWSQSQEIPVKDTENRAMLRNAAVRIQGYVLEQFRLHAAIRQKLSALRSALGGSEIGSGTGKPISGVPSVRKVDPTEPLIDPTIIRRLDELEKQQDEQRKKRQFEREQYNRRLERSQTTQRERWAAAREYFETLRSANLEKKQELRLTLDTEGKDLTKALDQMELHSQFRDDQHRQEARARFQQSRQSFISAIQEARSAFRAVVGESDSKFKMPSSDKEQPFPFWPSKVEPSTGPDEPRGTSKSEDTKQGNQPGTASPGQSNEKKDKSPNDGGTTPRPGKDPERAIPPQKTPPEKEPDLLVDNEVFRSQLFIKILEEALTK